MIYLSVYLSYLSTHPSIHPYYILYNRLESATGLELAGKIFNELGYCTTERKWKPALFAEGTNEQCMERVASILEQEGIERLCTNTHTYIHARKHTHREKYLKF